MMTAAAGTLGEIYPQQAENIMIMGGASDMLTGIRYYRNLHGYFRRSSSCQKIVCIFRAKNRTQKKSGG